MEGKTVILIIFGFFAVTVVGTIAVFFGRIVWAMRNPDEFKAFQQREIDAATARREAENENLKSGKPSWIGRFFGAVFLIIGLVVIGLSAWQIYEIGRGQFWTQTECLMTKSWVKSSISSRSATTFKPEVEYLYNFGGQNFTGNRLDLPNNSYHSREEAEKAVRDYPQGAKVVCYVNQEKAQESVLNRSPLQFPLFKFVTGILICFGLGGFLIYSSRRRKPKI